MARAAIERFGLERVYFVPAGVQPLKAQQKVTNFYHRYAMLALALETEERMTPSLLEAPEIVRASGQKASYTVETVRRLRGRLGGEARLFFLIGMDAFEKIGRWRAAEELLQGMEFIVAHRPGWPLEELAKVLPKKMRPSEEEMRLALADGVLETHGARIHLLSEVNMEMSATGIREAARSGSGLDRLVPAAVASYIGKLKLYDEAEEAGSPEPPRF